MILEFIYTRLNSTLLLIRAYIFQITNDTKSDVSYESRKKTNYSWMRFEEDNDMELILKDKWFSRLRHWGRDYRKSIKLIDHLS